MRAFLQITCALFFGWGLDSSSERSLLPGPGKISFSALIVFFSLEYDVLLLAVLTSQKTL